MATNALMPSLTLSSAYRQTIVATKSCSMKVTVFIVRTPVPHELKEVIVFLGLKTMRKQAKTPSTEDFSRTRRKV